MNVARSLLHGSSLTPSMDRPGLAIQLTAAACARGSGQAWVHGILALSSQDLAARSVAEWLPCLFVTLVPHDGGNVRAASAWGNRPVFQDHQLATPAGDGTVAARVPFSIDLEWLSGSRLPLGRHHVYVSARHYRTAPLLIEITAESGVAPAPVANGVAGDHLRQAYILASAGYSDGAVESFAAALADPAIAGDLDGNHVYNAACVAARAVLAEQGREAEHRLSRALGWLTQDVRLRREQLLRQTLTSFNADLQAALEKPADTHRNGSAQFAALHRATMQHFIHAYSEDPDLAALRVLPEFQAVYRAN